MARLFQLDVIRCIWEYCTKMLLIELKTSIWYRLRYNTSYNPLRNGAWFLNFKVYNYIVIYKSFNKSSIKSLHWVLKDIIWTHYNGKHCSRRIYQCRWFHPTSTISKFKEGIMHVTIILNSQCIIVLLQNVIWLVDLDIGALLGWIYCCQLNLYPLYIRLHTHSGVCSKDM